MTKKYKEITHDISSSLALKPIAKDFVCMVNNCSLRFCQSLKILP